MKRFLSILAAFVLCGTASAQTVKPLAYDMTNGIVFAATNVTWTNSFRFSTNTVAAQVRTNLGLGALSDVVFNQVVAAGGVYGDTNDVVLDTQNYLLYGSGSPVAGWDAGNWSFYFPFSFVGTNAAANIAITRTNLGLVWPALTNTNAANFQSALFSTNAAPTNTTNVAAWIDVSVGSGTNVYKLPVYK